MKKIFIILTILVVLFFLFNIKSLSEINKTPINKNLSETVSADVEIKEKMFLSQINDIYLNVDDYLGKTIKLEGIFNIEEWNNKTYCFVFRNTPGCCGADGTTGFSVIWENKYPNNNDWVEAIGVLEIYEEDNSKRLMLNLLSLKPLSKSGEKFVTQ